MSETERRRIQAYLNDKSNGEKTTHIRVTVVRAKKNLPRLKSDLALIETLLKRYA
ncbi:MAG: hypothetical protein V1857_06885 [archaeon]